MTIVGQRIRMTASELAMGRYMRAPDHPTADFDTAFAEFAAPEDKKPAEAAAAGDGGAAAASGGAGDGAGDAGAAAGSGESGSADAGAGDGAGAAEAGAAASGADDKGGAGAEAGAAGDGADDAAAGKAKPDAGSGDGAAADAGADAGADTGGDAAAAEAAAAAAAAGPDADAILAGLKKLVGQPAEAAPEDKPAAAAEEKPIYTAEETTRLAKYDEDWKEVAECEALKRRAEYQALLQHVFTQVAAFVKPIQETADAVAQRAFTTDVTTAVPDYSDQLREQVIGWVKKQPTYLQVAYNHVITEGTVDEVKDLIERYRTATNTKPAGAGGEKKPTGKENELSDEAKKAAAKLAPVDSKRSGVQAPSDPSDFEDAWKQAAADLG